MKIVRKIKAIVKGSSKPKASLKIKLGSKTSKKTIILIKKLKKVLKKEKKLKVVIKTSKSKSLKKKLKSKVATLKKAAKKIVIKIKTLKKKITLIKKIKKVLKKEKKLKVVIKTSKSKSLKKKLKSKVAALKKAAKKIIHKLKKITGIVKQSKKQLCAKHADIIFAVDVSGSIGKHDAARERSFVLSLISSLKLRSGVRVGVVKFASKATEIVSLSKKGMTHAKYGSILHTEMQFKGGLSNTGTALVVARQRFNSTKRSKVPQLVVIITDGNSNVGPSPIIEAEFLRDMGVTVLSVGVGKHVNRDELLGIASYPSKSNTFVVGSTKLLSQHLGQIARRVCKSTVLPPTNKCLRETKIVTGKCIKLRRFVTTISYVHINKRTCKRKVARRLEKCTCDCPNPTVVRGSCINYFRTTRKITYKEMPGWCKRQVQVLSKIRCGCPRGEIVVKKCIGMKRKIYKTSFVLKHNKCSKVIKLIKVKPCGKCPKSTSRTTKCHGYFKKVYKTFYIRKRFHCVKKVVMIRKIRCRCPPSQIQIKHCKNHRRKTVKIYFKLLKGRCVRQIKLINVKFCGKCKKNFVRKSKCIKYFRTHTKVSYFVIGFKCVRKTAVKKVRCACPPSRLVKGPCKGLRQVTAKINFALKHGRCLRQVIKEFRVKPCGECPKTRIHRGKCIGHHIRITKIYFKRRGFRCVKFSKIIRNERCRCPPCFIKLQKCINGQQRLFRYYYRLRKGACYKEKRVIFSTSCGKKC